MADGLLGLPLWSWHHSRTSPSLGTVTLIVTVWELGQHVSTAGQGRGHVSSNLVVFCLPVGGLPRPGATCPCLPLLC